MSTATSLRDAYRSFLDFVLAPCIASIGQEAARREEALRREMAQREEALREEMARREAEQLRVRRRVFAPPRAERFSSYLGRLQSLHPKAFGAWKQCFDRAAIGYATNPVGNCSISDHETANAFRRFLMPLLEGRVLDVGCGPQDIPVYLSQYPPFLISGIDPLPPDLAHDFEFVRGFAEFLPWEDETFDRVIVATSLDHVLCLDRSLAEVSRVLKVGGRFLVWVGFIPGSPPYDPEGASTQPIDEYHLFHFDEAWFEERVGRLFHIEQKVKHDAVSHFYSLSHAPRPE